MDNKVSKTNFKNSVELILQEFITTKYDIDNPFYELYACFDYKDVQESFKRMSKGTIVEKPIIHLSEISINSDKETYGNINGDKAQHIYLNYSLFCVVDENIKSTKKRKALLNELSSNIKNKFDNYKNNLNEFKNVSVNYSEGILGKNSDNLYASEQQLTFEIIKEF